MLEVLAAGATSMAIGALWYSPVFFGNVWIHLMGFTAEYMQKQKKSMWIKYIVAFGGALLMAYVFAYLIQFTNSFTLKSGAQAGFWIWLGFFATNGLGVILWEGRKSELYLINSAHQLISMVVMGMILAVWR